MAYTLKEKLKQLADTPAGGAVPAFFSDPVNGLNYVEDLQQLAREVLTEIERLEEISTAAQKLVFSKNL